MRLDLLYALRMLRQSPGFAATAILTLALGIGANAAVFSVIDSVLLRPLPFRDPGRLVLVSEYSPGNVAKTGSPLLRYQARAAQNTVFEQTAAYWDVSGGNGMVFGGGSAERLEFSVVTNGFFPILGVQPAVGRAFSPAEERPGGGQVFVASFAAWQRLMGGDPAAIGRSFRLDGAPYTLIGVLPRDFHFPGACALWLPAGTLGTWPLADRVSHQFWMLGRLRRGVSPERAQADMDRIQDGLAKAFPATDATWRVRVRPLLEEFVGGVRASLWILLGAVAFVLLIACANVVNLMLARAAAREREFAMRAALGAPRLRLFRQALTETLLLVIGGAGLALLLAEVGLHALSALGAGSIPRLDQPHLSLAVLWFCGGLALATTLLVGAAPGLASGRAAYEALKGGQRTGSSRRAAGLRNALVVSEIALTVLLLSGTGLLLRSFQQLRQVDPGFQPGRLVTVRIALPDASYPKMAQRTEFLRRLLENLNATPGIELAAATDRLPLSGETNWGRINIVGRPVLDSAHAPAVEGRSVSANYFRALGIPLVRGRAFTADDGAAGRRVVVINQEMAVRFWPGADPIGQRIAGAYDPDHSSEVIGVVGNVKDAALDARSPAEVYAPFGWWNAVSLVLGSGPAQSAEGLPGLVSIVRGQVARLDPEVPVYRVGLVSDLVSHSLAQRRFELFLLAVFAAVAMLLAAVGVYGLLSFAVDRRTAEIGLRMALGAQPRAVLMLILSQGMKLIAAGLAAGLAASLVVTRLLGGLLYGIGPGDPATLAAVAGALGAVGAAACWIPARRALSVSPLAALGRE